MTTPCTTFLGLCSPPLTGLLSSSLSSPLQVTLAHAYESNQRIVEQLNDQVDFLNRQLADREAQLSKVRKEGQQRGERGESGHACKRRERALYERQALSLFVDGAGRVLVEGHRTHAEGAAG